MKQFKVLVATVLLIAGIILLVVLLFTPQPIQIILETGQEIVTKNPNYFTTGTVLVLILCSFIVGGSITFLFYNAENTTLFKKSEKNAILSYDTRALEHVLPLLREDEQKAVRIIQEKRGEILQNELVLKLGLSKVKTTRLLANLERKQIISKQRHGLTNSIKLKII